MKDDSGAYAVFTDQGSSASNDLGGRKYHRIGHVYLFIEDMDYSHQYTWITLK